MLHVLRKLSVSQLRAAARSYRTAAARNAGYQETSKSYLRLAEEYDRLASDREAKGESRLPRK
jgi:hypothetical protein